MSDAHHLVRRPFTRDDAPALLKVINASEDASPGYLVTSFNDLVNEFDEPGHVLSEDTQAVVTPDGELIAFMWTWLPPDQTKDRAVTMRGCVHPDWIRQGLGRSLIEWGVNRARERLAHEPGDLAKLIRSTVPEVDPGAVEAYESCGFARERYFIEMDRDLSEPFAKAQLPDGLSLEVWSPAWDEAVRLAHNEQFQDHWGSEPITDARWKRWLSENESFLPNQSFFVRDGDEVAANAMSFAFPQEWAGLGHKAAWIGELGTRKAYRGQGIASALIVRSLEAFKEQGYDRGWLGVDLESPTGALGLYQSHGFKEVHREVALVLPGG